MKHYTIISYAFHGRPREYRGVAVGRQQLVGGAELYLFDLAHLLLRQGHEVTVIQAGPENREYEWEGIHIRQLHFHWIGQRLGLPEQWWGFNRYWLQALPKKTDHVHLHYLHHAWPSATSDMTATCHGITWDIPYDESVRLQIARYSWLLRKLQPLMYYGYTHGEKWLARQGLARVKKVASVDTALMRFAQHISPAAVKKINYIPNYVDHTRFIPSGNSDPVDNRLKGRRAILFPRMMSFNRGAHLLAPAMAVIVNKFPDALLVAVGSGNADRYVRDQVTKLGLEKNVLFLGHLDHDKDMPKHFQAAEIVIIPSIGSEGTSLSCLEAMATGKPIVASRVGGLPDLITHERNGLLITPTADELATAIVRLLENQALAATLAKRAHDDSVEKFSKERWEASYTDFFSS